MLLAEMPAFGPKGHISMKVKGMELKSGVMWLQQRLMEVIKHSTYLKFSLRCEKSRNCLDASECRLIFGASKWPLEVIDRSKSSIIIKYRIVIDGHT